jgi:hypothetical protein
VQADRVGRVAFREEVVAFECVLFALGLGALPVFAEVAVEEGVGEVLVYVEAVVDEFEVAD